MNDDRYVVSDFCDDVRQEAGNKISLMGCYAGDMIFEKFPAVLPKFCVRVRAITPLSKPFLKLIFRALLNDELLFEMESLPDQLAALMAFSPKPGSEKASANAIMAIAPFVVNGPGRLRIVVETEEGEIKGGFIDLITTPSVGH